MARVEIAPGAIEKLTDDMVAQYLRDLAPLILVLMKFQTPFDTGVLRASGTFDRQVYREQQSRVIRFRFPARSREGKEYAQIVFAGRREIRPVRAKALRWVTKSGAVVYAQKSRAVPPNRWTLRVFQQLGLRDARIETRR